MITIDFAHKNDIHRLKSMHLQGDTLRRANGLLVHIQAKAHTATKRNNPQIMLLK